MNTPAGALNTLSRTRWALLLFAVLATLAILGQTLWAIAQDKQQTLNSETTNGLVAVRLLEEHASQTLQDAVHTLDRVARAIQLSPHADDPTAIRNLVATHDISHSRHLKALQYVTPEGISWISSPDYPTHQSNASYRNHIQYLLHHPTFHGALVGRPYASAYDSQWVIPVARTLYNLNDPRIRSGCLTRCRPRSHLGRSVCQRCSQDRWEHRQWCRQGTWWTGLRCQEDLRRLVTLRHTFSVPIPPPVVGFLPSK